MKRLGRRAERRAAAADRHPAGKKQTLAEHVDDALDVFPDEPAPVGYWPCSAGREGWLTPDEADAFAALVAGYER